MTRKLLKRTALMLSIGLGGFVLSGCEGVTVGVGYGYGYDPFYDSMLWNDYYRNVNVNVNRPGPPTKPPGGKPPPPTKPPGGKPPPRPKPPVAKPPSRPRPPTARPPTARPPIHRPSPRR